MIPHVWDALLCYSQHVQARLAMLYTHKINKKRRDVKNYVKLTFVDTQLLFFKYSHDLEGNQSVYVRFCKIWRFSLVGLIWKWDTFQNKEILRNFTSNIISYALQILDRSIKNRVGAHLDLLDSIIMYVTYLYACYKVFTCNFILNSRK